MGSSAHCCLQNLSPESSKNNKQKNKAVTVSLYTVNKSTKSLIQEIPLYKVLKLIYWLSCKDLLHFCSLQHSHIHNLVLIAPLQSLGKWAIWHFCPLRQANLSQHLSYFFICGRGTQQLLSYYSRNNK